MTCQVQNEQGCLQLNGQLDREHVPDLLKQIPELISAKDGQFTVDLSAVEHVDSAGLAWLVHMFSRCQQQQVTMTLLNPSKQLQMLMKVSDLEGLIPYNNTTAH